MRNINLLLLFSLILSACSQNNLDKSTAIFGIWRMSESINKKAGESSNDPLLNDAKKLEEGKVGHVLSIFPDNTFTEIIGKESYSFGKWSWLEEGKTIQFVHSTKQKIIYSIEFDAKDTNNFVAIFSNSSKQASYLREAKLFDNYKEEPFYAENNIWRIHPKTIETKAQLLDRLGNYFKHMAYLLKAADTRNLDVVSFEFSMGIVQIFNGGIGIHDLENIPEEWKATYYNEENLLEVYNLYSTYLENNRYRGASSGDWVKDDYTILLNIYNDLKSGKF